MTGVPVLTSQEMMNLEARLFAGSTRTAEQLMMAAGEGAARILNSEFAGLGATEDPLKVAIFCGWGNNGGDGFVVARCLAASPVHQVTVFEISPARRVSELSAKMRKNIPSNVHVIVLDSLAEFSLTDFDVIVDAIFGIGLNRSLGDFEKGLIQQINIAGQIAPVLSLDIPSGLNSTLGHHWGAVVQADLTITFGAFKSGQWMGQGLEACGRICLESATFPKGAVCEASGSFLGFGLAEVESLLPRRAKNSHKYTNGKILIVAGSDGMWGAAILAATAALRAGAGHVTLASFGNASQVLGVLPEVLLIDLTVQQIDFRNYDACLVGPGLKDDTRLEVLIKNLAQDKISKVVLDATALNVFARWDSSSEDIAVVRNWILTPHEGEAKRLLGKDVPKLSSALSRWDYHSLLSGKFPCVFVLKGPKSWIFHGEEAPVFICLTGNDALAKAGAGDVLAGMITTFYSQGVSVKEAALLGSVVHGAAGDVWASSHGRRSLLVSELSGLVAEVLFSFEGEMEV